LDGLDPPAHPPGKSLGEMADEAEGCHRGARVAAVAEPERPQTVKEVFAEAAVATIFARSRCVAAINRTSTLLV